MIKWTYVYAHKKWWSKTLKLVFFFLKLVFLTVCGFRIIISFLLLLIFFFFFNLNWVLLWSPGWPWILQSSCLSILNAGMRGIMLHYSQLLKKAKRCVCVAYSRQGLAFWLSLTFNSSLLPPKCRDSRWKSTHPAKTANLWIYRNHSASALKSQKS